MATTRLEVEYVLGSGQRSVTCIVPRNALCVSEDISVWLYAVKDDFGDLEEAFAELSSFFTGGVDQDVCKFLRELRTAQVIFAWPSCDC